MFQQTRYERLTIAERLRTDAGRRALGFGLALLLEALLILALLTLGREGTVGKKAGEVISTFDASEAPDQPKPEDKPKPEQKAPPTAVERQPDQPQPPQPPQPQAAPPPPAAIIPVSPQMQNFDISKVPKDTSKPAPARPAMGPPDVASPNDTPVVGKAPNGEPLYAARWYREPTDQQLAGYLSTAQGPGWGLIACKTAPEHRVEDCVALGEYPDGSGIARAALAASWQFKVLPPRKGNRYLVGAWVRIRISLDLRPPPSGA